MSIKANIKSWITEEAQVTINKHYDKHLSRLAVPQLTVKYGRKYAKIMLGSSVWAFISLTGDINKGTLIGDLLKPASFRAPAKHSRGNILNATASYSSYGPTYL